jgi:Protein of unknown function (DUF1800)
MTTRRTVLTGAGVAAATTALAGPLDAAAAASGPATGRSSSRLLGTQARHLVDRFSYGVTPGLATQVRNHGGARSWFEWQLTPRHVADSTGDALATWFPHLAWSPSKLWQETITGGTPGWEVMADYGNWLLLRRMKSNRQVLEVMTEFWENHFNVPVGGDGVYTWRKRYGDVIRAHALDSFEALLQAVSVHPAMGIYLGNAVSDRLRPNENQGRELLELHTVGVGNYTENDVKSSARILTGYQVDMWDTWAAGYNELAHSTGRVKVGTFTEPNTSADGRPVTRRYLHYLAHHPDTAQRIAAKLATVFVRDDPPRTLVNHLASVYLAHGTRITPVLRALVDSTAFARSVDAKVRDPEADVVATYRALGVQVRKPDGPDRAAHQIIWQCGSLGVEPVSWPRPDGQPIDNASWSSPSRMLGSMQLHYVMSGGWWPSQGIRYRKPTDWLPKASVRFDTLVEHLSHEVLHRPATTALQKACAQSVAAKASDRITADHPVMRWLFPRLMTTLLDSPAHYRR